jgi:hypothetical protein
LLFLDYFLVSFRLKRAAARRNKDRRDRIVEPIVDSSSGDNSDSNSDSSGGNSIGSPEDDPEGVTEKVTEGRRANPEIPAKAKLQGYKGESEFQ